MNPYTYCPVCTAALEPKVLGGKTRQVCPEGHFTHWDNPIPVVAAIVEWGEGVVLVRSIGWPEHFFGLVTGFLEKGESAEEAVIREVKEETGLDGKIASFVGLYTFFQRNQLLMVYHIRASGERITLDETELNGWKHVPVDELRPWPMGTGPALQDWLRTQGYEREFLDMRKFK